MSNPKIHFKTITDFALFCVKNEIAPYIDLVPKKHSNMRGEFFHELSGKFSLDDNDYRFKIKEFFVFKIKFKKKDEGYLLKELFV